MGRSTSEVTESGAILPAASALGPEVYGGSAGVALFLAQLSALADNAEIHHTALGAIARSLRQVLDRPGESPAPLSLFVGRLGVAYTAHLVAALTGDAEPHSQAEALLERLEDEIDKPHLLDVIGGNAGAIPALLALSRDFAQSLRSERYRALAIALGEQLCRKAIRNGDVWTWGADDGSGPGKASAPLTGMSHGASGIAVALLELHTATGRSDFLDAARGAFAYEDSLFDPKVGNWPDLRATNDPATTPSLPNYFRAWCHGAPGIALARLRAATLDPERAEAHLAMARAAISTTLQAIDEILPRPSHDASLCHGLAGLLETLLCAGRQLGDAFLLHRASAVARVLIDRHGQSCDYPSGLISCAVNPSLLLGMAGTGYAFLRLHAAEQVPSILVVGLRGP
jgi:lantibiotic modifying enzyme